MPPPKGKHWNPANKPSTALEMEAFLEQCGDWLCDVANSGANASWTRTSMDKGQSVASSFSQSERNAFSHFECIVCRSGGVAQLTLANPFALRNSLPVCSACAS